MVRDNHPREAWIPSSFVRRRARGVHGSPLARLGLPEGASAAEIVAARRRLAKRWHPDAGGDAARMQDVNDAAAAALRDLASGPRAADDHGAPDAVRRAAPGGPVRVDHPSFTVEALPAATFEGLLIVATWLGDVIDDDPPYLLDVALGDPIRGWCRLDVVPDAGASTVSLLVGAEPGGVVPDLDAVRDAWVDGLNRLDWTDPPLPQPPS